MPARDFDSIYAGYSRLIYWAAYGVMKSPQDAMDVSQNVFLKVFRHLKTLEGMTDAQLKGWLYRVTVNLCVDDKRKRKREVLVEEDVVSAETDESVLPEISALNEETRRLLQSAIDSLPDIYREAVTLHYYAGLTLAEIAELSGATEGTIKSRISRARAKLCEMLKEGECIG